MNTAIVFISTAVDQVSEVADKVAAMPEVTEVYSVTGDMEAMLHHVEAMEAASIHVGRTPCSSSWRRS